VGLALLSAIKPFAIFNTAIVRPNEFNRRAACGKRKGMHAETAEALHRTASAVFRGNLHFVT
jgi:hypothetical protein